MCNFTHLHVHSEYSTLDGASRFSELIEQAKTLGQTAIACTDHGTVGGLIEFQNTCDKHGIKAIHGIEFYYQRENDGENGHLVVLAKDNVGLSNIFQLMDKANRNKQWKPRINFEMLKEHKEGLIVTSSCLGSTFNQYIMNGQVKEAEEWAIKFKELFSEDFYIELQPNQIPEQLLCNKESIRIARKLGIEIIATNDVHYTYEEDAFPHEVLLAIQTNKKLQDEKRFKFDTYDFWLKSEQEMIDSFVGINESDIKEALANTKNVEAKCNARIERGNYLADFHDLGDSTPRQKLIETVKEGAKKTGLDKDFDYMKMVQDEIDVIDRNGYSNYFLIVADYIQGAKECGVIVGDRGSVGGSKVAYLTGISSVEPREYDLLFERFLSDGRTPDIDADFSDQDVVYNYLCEKYGEENVARVVAFGSLAKKSVVRKVFSAFGYEESLISQIAGCIVSDEGSIEGELRVNQTLRDYQVRFPTEFNVILRIEGITSHESIHAGGFIIYPELHKHLPIKMSDGKRVVLWDKNMLEFIGHHKYDILKLETLPVIRGALESIKSNEGIDIDLDSINYEDPKVYEMLSTGDVAGVFQLSAQAQKVVEQQPRNFRDIIAINALVRPGTGDWNTYIARRRGQEWDKDPHRPWLDETFGTITYQEQFLLDCHHLAGWTVAYADKKVRKGKNVAEDLELKQEFIDGCVKNGHDVAYAERVWDEICASVGDYSFNKSHACTYAKRSYQTAWLKLYYPIHFFASIMTIEGNDQNAISNYVSECKKLGIKILPPDINISDNTFKATKEGIRFRINTIKHVGEGALKGILALRPIKSFDDFMERRVKKDVKANVVDMLIKSGCFDFDEPKREKLLYRVALENRTKTQIKEDYRPNQYHADEKLYQEWEMQALGFYLSSHPLEKYDNGGHIWAKEGENYHLPGIIQLITTKFDKKGKEMAFITLSTVHGSVQMLVFAYNWSSPKVQKELIEGQKYMFIGKKSGDSILYSNHSQLK